MSLTTPMKRSLIVVHRWIGLFFCLLFLWWFVSGIFMMYWDYPGIGPEDRLERATVLDPSRIRVPPEEAFANQFLAGPPDQSRLAMFDGRPAYWFRSGRFQTIVYADTGEWQDEFPPELTRRIAAAWAGQSAAAAKAEKLAEPDQWTVDGTFRRYQPLVKYSWPTGEQVYVSERTGEVVQYTTRGSRLGAYVGAIPHWLYFTPLRKNTALWSKIVIWSSGIGTFAAFLGLIVGLSVISPAKRYRFEEGPTRLPYRGWKRWHAILGLVFGLVTCTWAFSGMLSMDPFPQATARGRSEAVPRIAEALRGAPLEMSAFANKHPWQAVVEAGSDLHVKDLEFSSFAGQPVYLARESPYNSRIIPVNFPVRGGVPVEYDQDRILHIVRQASEPDAVAETHLLKEYDGYYLDRHNRLPLPVLFVRLNDAVATTLYIDPRTARVIRAYGSRERVVRWLYHGLHSMDLPWLYKHRPAWDIVVLALMLGGTSLCVTSVIIAFQFLRRKLGIRSARSLPSTVSPQQEGIAIDVSQSEPRQPAGHP